MRKAGWMAAWLLALALGWAAIAPAADGPQLVQRGRDLYDQARFHEAQEDLRAAIARLDLSPRQRAQAWAYLGFCYLALGHPEMAAQALVSARAADPAYAPDPAQLSPKARELWDISDPGRPAVAPPAPRPEPSPQPAPLRPAPAPPPTPAPAAIRETPVSDPQPRLKDLELAYDVRDGRPVGAARVFAPQTKRIHLWVGLENVPPGMPLRAAWTYLGDTPVLIIDTETEAPAGAGWMQFTCQLAPGRVWPAGRYQVELFLDQEPAGSLEFMVP